MAIRFRMVKKGEPGIPGGGRKLFYATAVSTGEVDLVDLTEIIEKTSTVSGADIRAVIYALTDAVRHQLSEGRIVRMGDIGSFRISISSAGAVAARSITARSIKSARLVFTPADLFKSTLNNLEYKKA